MLYPMRVHAIVDMGHWHHTAPHKGPCYRAVSVTDLLVDHRHRDVNRPGLLVLELERREGPEHPDVASEELNLDVCVCVGHPSLAEHTSLPRARVNWGGDSWRVLCYAQCMAQ